MFLLWRHNRRCDNRTCLECKTSVRSCFYLSLTDHKENSHTLSDLFPPHIRYTMAGWREKQSPTLCFRYSHGGFLSEMCPLDLPSIFCLSYQKYYKDVCFWPVGKTVCWHCFLSPPHTQTQSSLDSPKCFTNSRASQRLLMKPVSWFALPLAPVTPLSLSSHFLFLPSSHPL